MKVFFCFLMMASLAQALTKTYQVSLEVETLLGAQDYELQVQENRSKFDVTQKSKNPQFEIRLPIGKYQVRSRARDPRGIFGPWSNFEEVLVLPAPEPRQRTALQVTARPEDLLGHIELQWAEVEGISKYAVEIHSKDNPEAPLRFETTQGHFEKDLPIGDYTYQIKAISEEGLESVSTGAMPAIHITGRKLESPVIQDFQPEKRSFEWSISAQQNIRALVEYRYHLSTNWQVVDINDHLESPWKPEFSRNGVYRIQFWAEASGCEKSPMVTKEFVVKPTEL